MILLVALGSLAWAVDALGTTEVVWSGTASLDFLNVSIKPANGDFWFGADFVDPNYSTEPGVRVVSSTALANSSKDPPGHGTPR